MSFKCSYQNIKIVRFVFRFLHKSQLFIIENFSSSTQLSEIVIYHETFSIERLLVPLVYAKSLNGQSESYSGQTFALKANPFDVGIGIYLCPDYFYHGHWRYTGNNVNVLTGFGSWVFDDGSIEYVGEIENSEYNGFGVLKTNNLAGHITQYNGNFRNNLKQGDGVEICGDEWYDGKWENNLKHGFGVQYDNTYGLICEGDWQNGMRHGYGRAYDLATGEYYTGEWYENRRHGHGTLTFENNDEFCGDFNRNYYIIQGIMKYVNGDLYSGTFRNGLRNGVGVMLYANGNIFSGNWQSGTQYHGVMTFAKTAESYAGGGGGWDQHEEIYDEVEESVKSGGCVVS